VERVLISSRFLAATAVCCGLSVGLALWVAGGASGAARAVAGLIGLLGSLAVMLLIAAAASDETAPPVAPSPPVFEDDALPAPPTAPPPPPEQPDLLARRLDEGRTLRGRLDPAGADPRVDAWIAEARSAIGSCRPGSAGYFDALAGRTYDDDAMRLDAYLRRLETIVRGY
jgi:hypothetical protein